MSRLFGTDGVRGVANKDLTPLLAYYLGRAGAFVLSETHKKPVIVVGKDTRISGDMLESALIAGICSAGADVLKVGIMPTPSIAYLTRHFNADAGVVISASHNPVEYNGIKFFDKDGYKLPDAMEDEIEALVQNPDGQIPNPTGIEVGRVLEENGLEPYVNFVKTVAGMDFSGLKIAVDCANGASCRVAPSALKALGAEVYVINDRPDGCNINVKCGSTHPETISSFVKQIGADVGLSFDGDADRLIAVDEKGDVVDGDHVMAICGTYLHRRGLLKNSTVVTTVMSNMGLGAALKKAAIRMVRTKVGDRYVLEEILKGGHNFGGEQSGHIIFLDYNTTGDGLITAVNLLKAMVEEKKPLSELAKIMKVYPQVLLNVKVEDKSKYAGNARIEEAIKKAEEAMGERGRIVVRPSGTEPLIRVMVEGEDEAEINRTAEDIAAVIKEELR
ncbi:MAG: phosphoglucosamine mutase [Thermoanaerobacteraceae bacterium]|jgi:phosphoglucosamine mutase|uniref:Phosphoglucosamine mutase n=1 Tax=Biomaibacter acetigenes TaxID=2316383 RepID=A0A3G2R811_9FIRM|nr:phosphoglucosamine mutase [Biomaibacter acetigenes]AYO31674.1 phosphoglucosamine mutase [Biomaibacter acetigenes]MDK2879228.1 phosphoglucosamine mutase [Thermoanaerobacteraceae bacterium]MDN5302700.1 phosphoglucosamine mutase [Thermoanaerobacteraceae bacterium]MDN5312597.1 phosphoglucosamine mutase [Thermoanaerobacteraceae bacterium]